MRVALLTAIAVLCPLPGAMPALAADFTGFYAGVNAGYAFGRGRSEPVVLPGAGDATDSGRSLPPSAENASRAMRERPWGQGRGASAR